MIITSQVTPATCDTSEGRPWTSSCESPPSSYAATFPIRWSRTCARQRNVMNDHVGIEVGHRVLSHTADVIVEAWAPSRSSCLEELVRAFIETFADTREVIATREVPLEVGAARDDDVVVALLEDVCYLLDADGLVVVVDVALEEEDDGNFAGTFFVAPVATVVQTGAAPKGVSRSDLAFARDDGRWHGRVLVDV